MTSLRIRDKAIEGFFFLTGILAVVILLGIFVMLFVNGAHAFKEASLGEFLFSANWNPAAWGKPTYGIISLIVSTLMVTLGAMIIAVPLGVAAAAYIAEVARPAVREILKPAVEILAGIPSVVVGFLGIVLVGPLLARVFNLPHGLNALNGAILLAVMSLPTIITISEDAIRAVPGNFKEASLALGANRMTTMIRVTIPAAASGIITAIMLGVGRAIGETMTVLMATGNATAMPRSMFDPVQTMTATIAMELGEVPFGSTHYFALFAVGAVLFVMSFVVNLVAEYVQIRSSRHRV